MENYKNYIEQGNEYIPTKEEILGIIGKHAENYTIERELFDEKGLYRIEVKVEGDKAGEIIQYEYTRKGTFPIYESSGTVIHKVFYRNGDQVNGYNVADYNSKTGKWQDVE